MAVTAVNETWRGRAHEINSSGNRSYTRTFDVLTDDRNTAQKEVRDAAGVPRVGDVYPDDLGATATRVSVEQDPGIFLLWRVTVEYETVTGNQNQAAEDEDPLNRPAELEWSFAQFTKVADQDIDGNMITNSAGDPFDPPPEIDDSRPVLRIARNEAGFSAATAVEFMDAVNDDAFFGGQPGQVKVANISAVRQFENGIPFWRVVYEFHFRREGWSLQILDRGYRILVGGVPEPVVEDVKNPGGGTETFQEVREPILLNGAGLPKPSTPPPSPGVYLSFDVYKTKTFAVLGLP